MENLKHYREKMNETFKDGKLTMPMARENGCEHLLHTQIQSHPFQKSKDMLHRTTGGILKFFLIY